MKSEKNDICCELRRRKLNWSRHLLGREGVNDGFTALGWSTEDRRERGRPKTSWRKTAEKKKNMTGWKAG